MDPEGPFSADLEKVVSSDLESLEVRSQRLCASAINSPVDPQCQSPLAAHGPFAHCLPIRLLCSDEICVSGEGDQ